MSRLCLYFRGEPERDRWIPGDRLARPLARRLLRRKARPGGLDKVFANLCLGLDRLGVDYEVNLPFARLRPDDRVGVLGRGRWALQGYDRPNPIVAGIGLMTHPSEWPTLCEDYPVVAYLQHSEWANNVYKPYFGERCRIWPVGIDTTSWCPPPPRRSEFQFLIYDKLLWDRQALVPLLLDPIRQELQRRHLSYRELRYGGYDEPTYKNALQSCSAMIFLSRHESQGLAYQECLASGVPVLAWDPGSYGDPNCFAWGQPEVPATSVPYFDERCGLRFSGASEFADKLTEFLDLAEGRAFAPRDYVLGKLSLERCSAHFVEILEQAQDGTNTGSSPAAGRRNRSPPRIRPSPPEPHSRNDGAA